MQGGQDDDQGEDADQEEYQEEDHATSLTPDQPIRAPESSEPSQIVIAPLISQIVVIPRDSAPVPGASRQFHSPSAPSRFRQFHSPSAPSTSDSFCASYLTEFRTNANHPKRSSVEKRKK